MGKNAGAAMITTITMMRIPMKESIIMKIILMATITAGNMITAITTEKVTKSIIIMTIMTSATQAMSTIITITAITTQTTYSQAGAGKR